MFAMMRDGKLKPRVDATYASSYPPISSICDDDFERASDFNTVFNGQNLGMKSADHAYAKGRRLQQSLQSLLTHLNVRGPVERDLSIRAMNARRKN